MFLGQATQKVRDYSWGRSKSGFLLGRCSNGRIFTLELQGPNKTNDEVGVPCGFPFKPGVPSKTTHPIKRERMVCWPAGVRGAPLRGWREAVPHGGGVGFVVDWLGWFRLIGPVAQWCPFSFFPFLGEGSPLNSTNKKGRFFPMATGHLSRWPRCL